MSKSRIGLLTGPVGVGKTTIAGRVTDLARHQSLVCGGLLAPALKDRRGQKIGIWGLDLLTGQRRVLARTDRDLAGPGIGPYSFDPAALDWALDAVENALDATQPVCQLLVVDEIGKLELWHSNGLAPVLSRLAAGQASHALVLVRESLLAELQAKLVGVEMIVFPTSLETRGDLAPQVLKELFR